MNRDYLVTTVAKHAEAIRIGKTKTLHDSISYLEKLSNEFDLISEHLVSLHSIMKQKGMSEKLDEVPRRLPSFDRNYIFHYFTNSQFGTSDRIESLIKLGFQAKDIELTVNDAVYQERILYAALNDLYEAILWIKSYKN